MIRTLSTCACGLLAVSSLAWFGLADGAEPTELVLCAPRDAEILPADARFADATICGLQTALRKGFKIGLEDTEATTQGDRARFVLEVLEERLEEEGWTLEVGPEAWDADVCWVGLVEDALFDEGGVCADLNVRWSDPWVATDECGP